MAKASGHSLYRQDARVVLGMVARGDRDHDIAAWFGVNQGRIAEVKAGEWGDLEAAPTKELPPSGAPGIKGRRLRDAVARAIEALAGGDQDAAAKTLTDGADRFDTNEG